MKMKRKVSLIICMLLLVCTLQSNVVYAADEVKAAEAKAVENKQMNLSINDAVRLAQENSREMWKIDDGLKELADKRKDASRAKETAQDIMNMSLTDLSALGMDVTSDYISTLMAKNGYYITFSDLKTKEIEKKRELLLKGIEIEAKSLYYQVLVAEKTIEVNEGNMKKAQEQLRVINLKFNSGSATKAEVLNGEIAVQKSQSEIDSSKNDLQMAKLNLLNKLNLPFDVELTLTDKEMKYVPTSEIKLNEVIEKARAQRPEVLTALNNLELQKIETHVYTAYYTSNLRQNKAAVEKLKDAELKVPQVYKDVELDVRKSYLNLVKSERALINMDKTVELARESSRINKLLYQNGMAASPDVLESDTNLAQAEIGRYQLLISYNISKMMFDNCQLMGGSSVSFESSAE